MVFAGTSHGMHVIRRMSELRRVNLANALGSAFASVPILQDTVDIPIEFPEDFIQIQRMYAANTLPAVANFNGQTLAFPITVGSMICQVNWTLTAQSPEYIFRVVYGALIPGKQRAAKRHFRPRHRPPHHSFPAGGQARIQQCGAGADRPQSIDLQVSGIRPGLAGTLLRSRMKG